MGDIPLEIKDWRQVELNPFFCPDADKLDALDELMRALKRGRLHRRESDGDGERRAGRLGEPVLTD